ncbi:type II secretion system protein N [Brevundimonas sp.]|uniref:type II secretion system protein N n=1 Tax=Brevundimonas sp. TaxID=1871086 RepID=UPI002E11F9DD|nr:type II secretion system protein N [Brevundimonas sp.]
MTALLRSPVFWMRVVGLIVVVSLGLSAARLTWRLIGWDDGRSEVWTPAALTPVSGAQGGGLAAVLAWNPFTAGTTGDGLPASNLGLVLRGVIYAASGGSTALISSGGGPVQPFGVGENPVGSAVIEAIEPERVILNVGGRREALHLPKPTEAAAGAPAAALPQTAPVSSAPAPSPEGLAALAAASPVATAAAARQRPPQAQAAAGAVAGGQQALESMGMTSTGQGYVVGADSSPQLLRAGLRPGDVIRSVNGQALGDPDADRDLFASAAASGRLRIEVVRDGRTLSLTVPLR